MISLHKFYFDGIVRACRTQERYGQAMFNHLCEVRPEMAKMIRGTLNDPFHAESPQDPRWDRFVKFIETNWRNSDGQISPNQIRNGASKGACRRPYQITWVLKSLDGDYFRKYSIDGSPKYTFKRSKAFRFPTKAAAFKEWRTWPRWARSVLRVMRVNKQALFNEGSLCEIRTTHKSS